MSERTGDSEFQFAGSSAGYALVGVLLPLCWFGMMAVHEVGHVVGARVTGGAVTRVVLHPLAISRTDVAPNPHPNCVAWLGPMTGVGLPLLAWIVFQRFNWPGVFLVRFFAGFCAVANGLYLGVGSFDGVGDAGDLLRSGSAPWELWLFGIVWTWSGFLIWNGQAKWFGFGPGADQVSWRLVMIVAALLTIVLGVELALS